MKGRKPLPNQLKKLTNSQHYNPNGLETKPERPIAPAYLSDYAKSEWSYIVPKLDTLRILGKVDRAVLASYCEAVGTFREATEALQREGNTLVIKSIAGGYYQNPWLAIRNRATADILKLSSEFGMTPSSRSRFQKPQVEEEDQSIAKMLVTMTQGD